MRRMLIFGLGYSASVIARALETRGWEVVSTGRHGTLPFADEYAVRRALDAAEAVLSSVPPDRDGADPVLERYGEALAQRWTGYLSSTGVYGDTRGAWVDETAPTGDGRRTARAACDAAWLARGARVFRLPGIYGPGRSALDRVRQGTAHRIALSDQVFSRIHVDDLADGVVAGLDGPSGAYNLADDWPCSQNAVIEEACRLLGREPPPLQQLEEAALSPMARAFYAENRRVANLRARRVLGWVPRHCDYRTGLRAILAAGG
ncbi:MAG: SDR family NAD(P)-dependent oxidoreductase [Pseudomonadota bacterium]